jgi:hypothetical protein
MGWSGRGALVVLALVVLVLVLVLVGWVLAEDARSRAFNNRLHVGTGYWTDVVDDQAPIGDSRADVVRRLSAVLPKQAAARMLYDPAQRELVFSPQEFEVPGLKFPCAAWMILADIHFGPNDKVISRKVTEEGTCV